MSYQDEPTAWPSCTTVAQQDTEETEETKTRACSCRIRVQHSSVRYSCIALVE